MSERPRRVEVTDPVTITIDGAEIEVQRGELLIDAAERHGTYIPRFCYHPRMSPVGMCRMCLVEVDAGRGPALQPSCMVECTPEMVVDTKSDRVAKAQDGVLEFLLINHPLDCPVCDKGGECPLQDQTLSYGPGESRFVEEKRHYPKPIAISETVYLDRERCILCDRCTRFADEVAGDPLIHFMDRGANTQVNTFPDEPFASYFSGNTVQICPVGALTAKPFRFKARPWDLESVESTCTTCSVGCRITIQSSRDRVLRYLGVDADPVNWGWLCDRGRFGFESVGSEDRLGTPLRRQGDQLVETTWAEALGVATEALRAPAGAVAVLGGARLTNEAAYAWARLAKGVIGTDHVDAQLGDGLPADAVLSLPRATIDEVCAPGGTILLLGCDPKEELPVLFLRLRHAVVVDGTQLFELATHDTSTTPIATRSIRYRPGTVDLAVDELLGSGELPEGPLRVILGRPSIAESAVPFVTAAAQLLAERPGTTFLPALRRGNVAGALDMGLTPGCLPGRQPLGAEMPGWATTPKERGLDAAGILAAAADGKIDTLVLVGADPVADFPDRNLAERALAGARRVIAVDRFLTESSRRAEVVLPAAGFAEVEGTTTNLEGRISAVHQKVNPPGTAWADWLIAAELARRLGDDWHLEGVEDLWDQITVASSAHAAIDRDELETLEGADGLILGFEPRELPNLPPEEPVPVDAYSLRLVAHRRLYDGGTDLAHCPSSAPLAEPPSIRVNPTELSRLGVAKGDSIRVIASDRSFTASVTADAGVPVGVAVMAVNQSRTGPSEVIDISLPVTEVRLEVVS